jgi:hypothetical protein
LKIRILFFSSFLLLISSSIFSQITDEELGRALNTRAGLYDFSDPGAINIKVSVWGYVSKPGKYVVPEYTTVSDLLSYAGGPNQNAETDDLRIFRTLDNGTEEMIKFTYDDIIWGDGIEVKNRILPKLEPSDILVVPGSPRYFFKDWFSMGLSVFSIVMSIINLVLLIQRYN